MPIYCFTCEDCDHLTEIVCSMNKISSLEPQCENCSSQSVYREWNEEKAYSKPPIKTLGMLADINTEKFSDDYKRHLQEKQRKQTRSETSELEKRGFKKYDPKGKT